MKNLVSFLLVFLLLQGCRSDTEITSPDDGVPPAVPSGLRITFANDGEIILEWAPNREPDFDEYHIYRSTDLQTFSRIASTDIQYFLDDSLDYDITYYYKLSAEDFSGRESELSDSVFATPVNVYAPAKPMNLQVNGRNLQGSLSTYLSWYPGFESDIIGYNIYRSTNETFPADTSTLIGFAPDNNFIDRDGLVLYKRYYYRIRGVDRGLLIGKESDQAGDIIIEIPEVFYPPDGAVIDPFPEFIIKAVEVPAVYRIVVQTNEFFGEIWSGELSTQTVKDTITIPFTPQFLLSNRKYYWRIAAYTKENDPNSVSGLFNFTIKPG